jgi:hypothetical protein
MPEVQSDLWSFWDLGYSVCITTNGTVRMNGSAVMGRGCAWQAARRFPELPAVLGSKLLNYGNHVHVLMEFQPHNAGPLRRLFSFPVKHDWFDRFADLNLIRRSYQELSVFRAADEKIALPRPGCGVGNLRWEEVRCILDPLPGWLTVVFPPNS